MDLRLGFPGSINNQAYWDNNDAMFLAQVPTDSRSDMTKYSFFAGLNNDGYQLWTFDSLEAQYIHQDLNI